MCPSFCFVSLWPAGRFWIDYTCEVEQYHVHVSALRYKKGHASFSISLFCQDSLWKKYDTEFLFYGLEKLNTTHALKINYIEE